MGYKLIINCFLNEANVSTAMPPELDGYIQSTNSGIPTEIISGVIYPAFAVKNLDFISIKSLNDCAENLWPRSYIDMDGLCTTVVAGDSNRTINGTDGCRFSMWGMGLGDVSSKFFEEYRLREKLKHKIKGKFSREYNSLVEDMKGFKDEIIDGLEIAACDTKYGRSFYIPIRKTGQDEGGMTVRQACALRDKGKGVKVQKVCALEDILGEDILFMEPDRIQLADFFIKKAKDIYSFEINTEEIDGVLKRQAEYLTKLKQQLDDKLTLGIWHIENDAKSIEKEKERVMGNNIPGVA
jgi:hypothetical protein